MSAPAMHPTNGLTTSEPTASTDTTPSPPHTTSSTQRFTTHTNHPAFSDHLWRSCENPDPVSTHPHYMQSAAPPDSPIAPSSSPPLEHPQEPPAQHGSRNERDDERPNDLDGVDDGSGAGNFAYWDEGESSSDDESEVSSILRSEGERDTPVESGATTPGSRIAQYEALGGARLFHGGSGKGFIVAKTNYAGKIGSAISKFPTGSYEFWRLGMRMVY